jgi:hypothetical protein
LLPTLVTLLCILILFGCNSSSSQILSGKYFDEGNPLNFTEFRSDKTFVVHRGSTSFNGSYTTDGHILTLKLSTGEIFKGKIEGKTIIGDGGGRSTQK